MKVFFYAVRAGRRPGIYKSWDECLEQIHKFQGADYKKFPDFDSAKKFLSYESKEIPKTLQSSETEDIEKEKKEIFDNAGIVYTDGGSRGNPGIAGCGAALYNLKHIEVASSYKFLGRKLTNNIAEYEGVLLGMELATEHNVKKLEVRSDSKLAVSQIQGKWAVRHPDIMEIWNKTMSKTKNFESFSIKHIDREMNSRADELANKGMDLIIVENNEI
ncbi:unnamed protein product [Blepharisma stoltei]|uniref:Ribonuclease H n=1 Tax=Blepharisma stoltei TaxID=1481888 RepID=A0AAU9JVR2_9CILI|nr:unnamed protein product [Blepharisma stoltei]